MDKRDGTEHVGWSLRVPAKFWGLGWAKATYGDAWDSTEWLVTVQDHRPGSPGIPQEWRFVHTDGDTYAFGTRLRNSFLKEKRLVGEFSVLFFNA